MPIMAREWDTPIRGPWNALIKQALDAIDRHEHLYRKTGNGWHAAKAHELRRYVVELKTWIHQREALECVGQSASQCKFSNIKNKV